MASESNLPIDIINLILTFDEKFVLDTINEFIIEYFPEPISDFLDQTNTGDTMIYNLFCKIYILALNKKPFDKEFIEFKNLCESYYNLKEEDLKKFDKFSKLLKKLSTNKLKLKKLEQFSRGGKYIKKSKKKRFKSKRRKNKKYKKKYTKRQIKRN